MELNQILVQLEAMLAKWGIAPEDWILSGQYVPVLAGFDMTIRRPGHNNVYLRKSKIKLKAVGRDVILKEGSEEQVDYNELLKTGYTVDLVPALERDMRRMIKSSFPYQLKNGKIINVLTPIGFVKLLTNILRGCAAGKWGADKARRMLEALGDLAEAAKAKGDFEIVKQCKAACDKYIYLLHEECVESVNEIKGKTAMRGIVRGRARVLSDISDPDELKQGEILVMRMTTPKITPIIKLAKAIVTDDGGALCHVAILAREYKIPCVVGTRAATKIFKTGDKIFVDADKAIVRKEE